MYYSQNDLINIKLMAEKALTDSAILNDLIESDLNSVKKKNMVDGENYFYCAHDYLSHKNYIYPDGKAVEDKLKANNLAVTPFHKLMVLQKRDHIKDVSYSVKEPELVNPDNPTSEENKALENAQELKDYLSKVLSKRFNKNINSVIDGSSNKGLSWLHPYIDGNGNFTYTIIDAKQCIPIYDTQYQDRLISFIRYYTYDAINTQTKKEEKRYKLEWWDANGVKYWEQQIDKTFAYDMFYTVNPAPHWSTYNTSRPNDAKKHSWGRPPFIPVYNNPSGTTDLEPVKPLIDAYDKVYSGWCNDLEDFQEIIYVVKNMQSLTEQQKSGYSELGFAMKQMKTNKMVAVGSDGGVDKLEFNIPVEAKERFLKITREAIFMIGQGVDPAQVGDGNITNVVIQARYSGLNMKCDSFLQELESALKEFMWFVVEWANRTQNKKWNYEDIEFLFKKADIINQSEILTDVINTFNTGKLDERTFLENVYFIKNVDQVIKRLDQEKQKRIEEGYVDLNRIPEEENKDQNIGGQ